MKNNPKDLPRGLKMDTTTGENANMIKLAKGGSAKRKRNFLICLETAKLL